MLKPIPDYIFPQKYLIITFLLISVICYPQQNKLHFTFNDTPLPEVIEEISRQSKVNILYNSNILPKNHKITRTFSDYTLTQILDTLFKHNAVWYKYYKNNIVLYKRNEEVIEKHSIANTSNTHILDKKRVTITDTVTYSIITHDTIVTRLMDVAKVMDTVKIYDTVKVIQNKIQPLIYNKPNKDAFGAGISCSQGFFYSSFHFNNSLIESGSIVKSTLKEKNYNAIGINFLYKHNAWLFETGLTFSRNKYAFDYSSIINEIVTRNDTIDKYYTLINGSDTNWVYIIEEKQVEVSTQKSFLSDLTYQYISVPLFIGYNRMYKRLALEFKTGIIFSYYLGSKGFYLSDSPDREIIVNKSKAPDSKFSIDILGAFAMDYLLTEEFHVFVQPYFGYTSLSPGNNNIDYYTINFQFGIQTGLRFFFINE